MDRRITVEPVQRGKAHLLRYSRRFPSGSPAPVDLFTQMQGLAGKTAVIVNPGGTREIVLGTLVAYDFTPLSDAHMRAGVVVAEFTVRRK